MAKVSVIVPAAGAGKRFGEKRNKIYERIKDQPLFLRTLEAFTGRDDVVQVQLVIAAADRDELKARFGGHLGFMGVSLCEGGATRPESVRSALANVTEEADLVCVHDAVRPCISPLWIDAVFAEAVKTGAAILAYPVHGTLKKVSQANIIDETVAREDLWEAQTPQVFARELLQRAYAGDLSDEITTRGDLALAAAVIGSLPKPKRKGPDHPFAEARW